MPSSNSGSQRSRILPPEAPEPEPATPQEEAETDDIPKNVHERLRGLTLVQQLKTAREGDLSERILLERIYGKNVWEAILRNPRVTGPEVARIARMGALPRPMIELIVGNGALAADPRGATRSLVESAARHRSDPARVATDAEARAQDRVDADGVPVRRAHHGEEHAQGLESMLEDK